MEIDRILEKMTLAEKIALFSGKNFRETKAFEAYGIPSLFMCDGPHGLRKQNTAGDMLGINESAPATCFPAAVTIGMSWDVGLMERFGRASGKEASAGGPLRRMQISGGVKGGIFEGLLHMENGHFFKGIKTMIAGQ